MQVSTSAFYAWSKMPEDTDKKTLKKQLEAKAIELFEENKNVYGSRRLSEAFIKEDIQVGRYKARQLMKKLGLKARYPKRFKVTTDSDHNEAISPNLLNRQFHVLRLIRYGQPISLTSGPFPQRVDRTADGQSAASPHAMPREDRGCVGPAACSGMRR